MSVPHIYFVAAEASGDLLAREVITQLRTSTPGIQISGIGGHEMAGVGIISPLDLSPLSILGLFEGLRIYDQVIRLADAACADILKAAPDVVVLVDSWGFMLRLAQRLRKAAPQIRLVKLIGPQVWATRPGRAKVMASIVDHLLCMYDLEAPFYEPHGLKTTVIGNPALFRGGTGDRRAFRAAHGLSDQDQALLVLPGSRAGELARVAPAVMEAAKRVKAARPETRLFVQPAETIRGAFEARFAGNLDAYTLLEEGKNRHDAMAGADAVIACSGTVTSEVAMQGTPMVVCYRTGWMTWAMARGFLYSKTHITLLNILNDDSPVVPEFVQTRQRPELISAQILEWLSDPATLSAQRGRQLQALKRLIQTETPAARLAAGAILTELSPA